MNETEIREYMVMLFDKDLSHFYSLWERLARVKGDSKDRVAFLMQQYGKDKVIGAMLGEGLLSVGKPE